jgi:hypothetical protein
MNVNCIALNSDRISLGIDPNAYGSADTPEIFPVSTKEGIGSLGVIKDDLLYNS